MAAVITSISRVSDTSPRAREGEVVDIIGTGFSATANTVTVNGTSATPSFQSTTKITITIPVIPSDKIQFQVLIQVINTDDSTIAQRYMTVPDTDTDYVADRQPAQQPGPQENPATETDTVAEAKDLERITAKLESWFHELLPDEGNATAPNVLSGAVRIGTNPANFQAVSFTPTTVQAALEALDAGLVALQLGGKLVQAVITEATAEFSTTAVIPLDNTAPQVGEGFAAGNISITPKLATTKLWHISVCSVGHSTIAGTILTTHVLGIDTTDVRAAQVAVVNAGTNGLKPVIVIARYDHPDLTAVTFNMRLGTNVAGTAYINRQGAGSIWGANLPIWTQIALEVDE